MTDIEDTAHYAYSFDEEHYHGESNSIEAALEEAKEDREFEDAEPGSVIEVHIGRCIPITAEQLLIDADDIIERAQERCYDYAGEIAETYIDDWHTVPKEKKIAIDAALHIAILDIFARHEIDLSPTCYGIEDVKSYKLDVPPADEAQNGLQEATP